MTEGRELDHRVLAVRHIGVAVLRDIGERSRAHIKGRFVIAALPQVIAVEVEADRLEQQDHQDRVSGVFDKRLDAVVLELSGKYRQSEAHRRQHGNADPE